MKFISPVFVGLTIPLLTTVAQAPVIPVGDNLVVEGIPAIPASIINEVRPYTEFRSASFFDWHPASKEMVISTRFANVPQLHYVKNPGGARKQLTFESEPISFATFEPVKGSYLLIGKDIGGNEFAQIYRYSFENGSLTLLTDGGRSQNGGINFIVILF